MAHDEFWHAYPKHYRAKEMETIAKWVATGDSGSVVGLIGCGRTHLLGYLCNHPKALKQYLPSHIQDVIAIPVDLYNLPNNDLSSLYRTILHAFYWISDRFKPERQQTIRDFYLENRAEQDPFLPQMALYDLLRLFQEDHIRIILVFNRFDRFCETATPQMANTLRGLRDSFRETLSYVMGMLKDVIYLSDPAQLGDLYELLVGRVCWVGRLNDTDARLMLDREFREVLHKPNEQQIDKMIELSGGFPSLLKGVAQWWLLYASSQLPTSDWHNILIQEPSIRFRLERIWQGLTQEEQYLLKKIQVHQLDSEDEEKPLKSQRKQVLSQLEAKGLCVEKGAQWSLEGTLLTLLIAHSADLGRGRIWLDEKMRSIIQDDEEIELAPMEFNALRFFIKHPHAKHTVDKVIDNTWPEEEYREGITNNALHVQIRNIRRKIEPDPSNPKYLITWHGRPGGYIFYPEGKPV
ncbi:MAG: hypothetical protein ACI9EW_003813 [Cellvibrionaceae bacterium]|jgi:hypothetical protein